MNISHHDLRHLQGSIADIFKHILTVDEVRELHDNFFYGVKKLKRPAKKLTKPRMIEAFNELSKNAEETKRFVENLSDDEKRAYQYLIWQDHAIAAETEKKLGLSITQKEGSYGSGGFLVRPEFPLISLIHVSSRYYMQENLDGFVFRIPVAIRKWLRKGFPNPEGHEIKPLSSTDPLIKDHKCFDVSSTALADLGQLTDYLQSGAAPRTKKGDFTKTAIRKAAGLTAGEEWYPKDKSKPNLALMRHEVLLDFIEGFLPELNKQLLSPAPKANIFKEILKSLKRDEESIQKWLIGHLKHRYKYYEETFNASAIDRLFGLFKLLPIDKWVSAENLKSVQLYQDIDVQFFDNGRYTFRMFQSSGYYNYDCDYDLDEQYLQKVGIEPLINGTCFILAAFGFLEIAYTEPKNETYHTEKIPYLSTFDGALAIRLTEIGAYAFGLTSKLSIKQSVRKVATLRFHPEQLHVTCSHLDPITELTLKEFMERIAPEFYRMTRASMLKGCQTTRAVRERIKNFRARINTELPENWNTFLSSLENEQSALQQEYQYSIFNLADRPDLQRHFTQDPLLRRHALRVEGHRIAIAQKDILAVRKQLRKLGYLVEI